MNTTPQVILDRIKTKRQAEEQRVETEQQARERERAAYTKRVSDAWLNLRQQIVPLLPPEIVEFVEFSADADEPPSQWQKLICSVPGLAPIMLCLQQLDDGNWSLINRYVVPAIEWYPLAYKPEKPHFDWHRNERTTRDIDEALLLAQQAEVDMQISKAEFEVKKAEHESREQEEERKDAESYARHEAEAQQEADEFAELVDVIRNDDVLVALLKLVIAIQNNRDGLREQIESMSYTQSGTRER